MLTGIAVLAGLGLAALVVERLTRPSDTSPTGPSMPQIAQQGQPIVESDAVVPPPPAEPSLTETVTEGKLLGTEISSQFPDSAPAMALAGKAQFTFGDPDQAQEDWERAIELDSQSVDAWLGLAKTAHKRGDFDRAVQHMRQLAEVNPNLADSQVYFLTDSLLKLGRSQEVVETLEEISETTSLPGGARETLGQAYYQLREYERSADYYRQILDDPQHASAAHYGLSRALKRLGRQDEAQAHLQEYARLQQEDMAVFDRMQHAGTDEERNDPAPLYPILAGFHFETAKLYAMRGDRNRAEEHALRAWALAPERAEPRLLLESFRRR